MAPVWSTFSRAVSRVKWTGSFVANRAAPQNVNQIRQMSEHNKFVIQPTRWQWHKFKDLLHLYILVGGIPLSLVSLYANLFIGPAELAPIPEGYVPKEYEYFRHPITRFFKKYLIDSEQKAYEKHLHFLWYAYDDSEFRRIEKEVKELQEKRADYQYWYFLQPDTYSPEIVQQDLYESHNTAACVTAD